MEKIMKIDLENTENTRDLGGYTANDGRKIKNKRLIRSDKLSDINESDARILKDKYNLKTIVDLRTNTEAENYPDVKIDGVNIVSNPILSECAMGITQERKIRNARTRTMFIKSLVESGQSGEDRMIKLYESIITDKYALVSLSNFFDILLSQKSGAVLWHCSKGKDRAGIATVLLLSALGIPKETILFDYLKTAEYVEDASIKEAEAVACLSNDMSFYEHALNMGIVKESYIQKVYTTIDNNYGGMRIFLNKQLNLNEEKLEKLKEMYLE